MRLLSPPAVTRRVRRIHSPSRMRHFSLMAWHQRPLISTTQHALRCSTSINSPAPSPNPNVTAVMRALVDKICDDQLVIYGDAFYQNVKTRNEMRAVSDRIVSRPQANRQSPFHQTLQFRPEPNLQIHQSSRNGRSSQRFQSIQSFSANYFRRLTRATR